MKKYKIVTLGCKVNSYESEALALMLEERGFRPSPKDGIADVCLINTCSVTSRSDAKSRQRIRHLIRENPGTIMIVMGCYSQLNYQDIARIEGVSIIIGTNHRSSIPKLIKEYEETNTQIIKVDDSKEFSEYENLSVIKYSDNTRAYVKIQDGCDNYCSYCIIPYTRGRVKSRNKDSVLNEIKSLVKSGYKEIVLTGIHTGGYGLDFDDYSFGDLLKDIVNEVKDLKRLRISSIEVHEITDEIIELMATTRVIVDHLHIPLQSGSNNVLRRMNRKYDKDYIIARLKKIRDNFKDIAITTDVIVGFPGESDEEFDETVDTINKIGFDAIHVFPFSSRKGTPASKMSGQVTSEIKKERVNKLLEISKQAHREYANRFIGSEREVLFETIDSKGKLKGHTTNYLIVKVDGDKSLIGQIKNVLIKGFDKDSKDNELLGEIIHE